MKSCLNFWQNLRLLGGGVVPQGLEWGTKPCQGPQGPQWGSLYENPYYFTLGLRAPHGPICGIGPQLGPFQEKKAEKFTVNVLH